MNDPHEHPETRRVPLPEGDDWSLELDDPSRRQLLASVVTGVTALFCLTFAARRAQLSSPNELLTLAFGLGLAAVAIAALARWRFTRAHLPLTLTLDPERVSMPHLGWRFGLVSIPWDQLTGVGIRRSNGDAHAVALVTESRTYLLPRELLPEDLSPVQIAGIVEHFRARHSGG